MAKNSIRDFSSTAGSNTDIQSINIDEGCAASNLNNAVRELMADLKDVSTGAIALESPQVDSLTSSGNLLVGTTGVNPHNVGQDAGVALRSDGRVLVGVDGDIAAAFNRNTTDGDIVLFKKAGSEVGSIGTKDSRIYIGQGDAGLFFNGSGDSILPFNPATPDYRDAAIDIGASGGRFKNLYLSGGVYLGGTGASNLLSDYEEGTYTVSVTTGNTGSINLDTANDTFTYTKIGDLVHVQGRVRVDSVSSPTGFIYVSLPFTIANLGESASMFSGSVTISGISSGNISDFVALGIEGNSNFRIYLGDAVSLQDDSAQQILASTLIYASITYRAA